MLTFDYVMLAVPSFALSSFMSYTLGFFFGAAFRSVSCLPPRCASFYSLEFTLPGFAQYLFLVEDFSHEHGTMAHCGSVFLLYTLSVRFDDSRMNDVYEDQGAHLDVPRMDDS
jgi:hypothetical protein